MKAIIGIGSNMGDRKGYIDSALAQIEKKAGKILAVSHVLETKAYGYEEQDDFLNLAIMIDTQKEPEELLQVLHEIEASLDRVRLIRWGPRTIDLDIIFFEDRIIDREELHIPHIDMPNREFVLLPVSEIAPEWVDPRSGKTVKKMLEELKNEVDG